MKKLVSSILITAGLLPAASFAAEQANKLTFQGEIISGTCNVVVNNSENAVVTLPTVPSSSLAQSGQTAGDTLFYIKISNCPNRNGVNFWITPDTPNGNVSNSAGTAGNVEIRLEDPFYGTQVSDVNNKLTGTGFSSANEALIPITAKYYATAPVTGGTVEGSTVFFLEYL